MGNPATIKRTYAVTLSEKSPAQGGSGWIKSTFTVEVRAKDLSEAINRVQDAGIDLDRFDIDTIERIED